MRFLTLLSLSAAARQAIAVTYTADNGKVFDIQPSTDYYGGDLTLEWTDTLNQCLDRCSVTTGCILVSFIGPGRGPCYMKSSLYQSQTNTQVTGAKLMASATGSVSSSATSTSISSTITSSASLSSATSSSSTTSSFKCTSSASGWELIGDLKVQTGLTPVGVNITSVLKGDGSAEAKTDGGYTPTGPLGSAACKADTCCVWSYIAADLKTFFTETDKSCNTWARRAVRLGFHDAAGWSKPNALAGKDFGGADGSIALSAEEAARPEHKGLEEIIGKVQEWQATYGVGMADLIQFASNVAAVVCPLGPRTRTWVGRKDSSVASPLNLVPDIKDSTDKILCMFADKSISYNQLIALLGAHSTSQQFFVDPSKAGQPQDDTPGVWDTKFYQQHRPGQVAPSGVFQFSSDLALANDTRAKDQWTIFAISGRPTWAARYATAYVRLSMLGVNNMNNLTECSHVLPQAVLSFP